ncbi:sugar phosphate isomerase/epimerase family protein [Streptomyces sp. SID13031]|uniref:sugar phosphate isomerase/epimerase family protein n=1 Tax=Streptomyces sp. SID13031 TaxID=2706046 RepID=UPI0013CCEC8E|nr:sugar phosphate isomerase/epimerase family protein [Streptomyces sp. SID13031]NEA36928.1 sugar phosphate isomerase/epimerase [Streptomyces sp. SID13031]
MSVLSVSTYSLREQLGPLSFDFTDADGNDLHFGLPYQKLLDLSGFPQRARDELGVQTIETVAFQFGDPDNPELDKFAAALVASGVRLLNCAIDAGDLLETDADKRAADVALLKRWIDRFVAMDSAFIRVNAGSPLSPHNDGGTPPDHLVEALVELGTYAAAKGARLLVENHGGPSSDPVWMSAVLDAVGREHLGLLLDLGNFDVLTKPMMGALLGGGALPTFDSIALTPLYEGIEALAPRAELVHVKVNDVDDSGTIGAVDLERALKILAAQGYDGPLTVEYEGNGGDPWQKTRHIVDVTRSLAPTAEAH